MPKNTQSGFTLMELMIVVALIAILASALIASVSTSRKRALDTATQGYIRNLITAYAAYSAANPNEDLTNMTDCNDSRLVQEGAPATLPTNLLSSCSINATSTKVTMTAVSLGGKTLSLQW